MFCFQLISCWRCHGLPYNASHNNFIWKIFVLSWPYLLFGGRCLCLWYVVCWVLNLHKLCLVTYSIELFMLMLLIITLSGTSFSRDGISNHTLEVTLIHNSRLFSCWAWAQYAFCCTCIVKFCFYLTCAFLFYSLRHLWIRDWSSKCLPSICRLKFYVKWSMFIFEWVMIFFCNLTGYFCFDLEICCALLSYCLVKFILVM